MLKFFSRFLGFWIVAAALVAAIVDGAKSIGASSLVVTPVSGTWQALAGLAGWETPTNMLSGVPAPVATVLSFLLDAPTVLVLAVIGVALLMLGAKRRRPSLGREFMA